MSSPLSAAGEERDEQRSAFGVSSRRHGIGVLTHPVVVKPLDLALSSLRDKEGV